MNEKTLLVLGGSSDMGMELISNVKDDYCHIYVQYRTMNKRLEQLKKDIGDKIDLVKCDFLVDQELFDMVEYVCHNDNIPTHIVHFAADRIENIQFHKTTWTDFQKNIDISFKSVVYILEKLIPYMKKIKQGKIVIMLSQVVDKMPYPNISNYVTTKYALWGLVRSLAVEYAKFGITINAVSPSWVNTKFLDSQPEILIRNHAEESVLGRNLECNEVVPSIQFLLSSGSDCINGQNIFVTCGE